MPSVTVDPAKVHEFKTADAFYRWLSKHHDSEDEVWIKIHKVSSGLPSITPAEAIDVVLCWGWIDGIRKGLDETSYLQRYTKRRKKSTWSQINVSNVARLIAEGRMTEHGLKEVDAAKADGRWDAAYASPSKATVPEDLAAALAANPRASAFFAALDATNRYAVLHRVHTAKKAETRAQRIARFVEMLARHEKLYP